MILKGRATRRGFTLVELLLVIVLIAILMALVTLSGFGMVESTNAQTEARRIIRTVHALRSAWLAHHADTQRMIGVSPNLLTPDEIYRALSDYSDRSLQEEMNRYGEIQVIVNPPGRRGTFVGFAPTSRHSGGWSGKSAVARNMIMESLKTQENDYELFVNDTANQVFIRIR